MNGNFPRNGLLKNSCFSEYIHFIEACLNKVLEIFFRRLEDSAIGVVIIFERSGYLDCHKGSRKIFFFLC